MKNLVLGVAKGYGWDALEPFVTSFVRNCPDAELVLFVDDISDFTRGRLIRAGVLLEDIPAEFADVLIVNARFKIYGDFLERRGANHSQVFITDTADVIFQGDVFATFNGYKNYLGYATEALTIGEDKTWNYPWLEKSFGKAAADRLADKKIICAGTVIGTVREMKIFCREMWNAVKRSATSNFDQAVMNRLVRENLLPIENLIALDVERGAILTNGLIKHNKTRGDKILRGDGGVPAVVHQYNRHNDLIELVDALYRDKNFQADGRFTDTRSTIEQATCLLFANKVGDAAQLFMKKFLVTTDFGGCVGALIGLWSVALRRPISQASGLIELSVQDALKSVKQLSRSDAEKINNVLKRARESHHPVDDDFILAMR